MTWKLFDRRTKKYEGHNHFYEKWVDHETDSGMVFYSTVSEHDDTNVYGYKHPTGSVYYVVEAYGTGTIDPYTFKEKSWGAPIERYEFDDLSEAKHKLKEMKERE